MAIRSFHIVLSKYDIPLCCCGHVRPLSLCFYGVEPHSIMFDGMMGMDGLLPRAVSLAADEYFSTSSQSHGEEPDITREKSELASVPGARLDQSTRVQKNRGPVPIFMTTVAPKPDNNGHSNHWRISVPLPC